ncbi:serine hydrolase domain-containing protein [Aquimarina sp. 2201CG5-10]|uniref:serine hydrolase domain-containing protein n=1 Tax=Aquimarina callyspongiae TaxID=3098150 RepID=UPI002AB45D59|nr:serine hydrolase domain-containing protein [Aquimarina sp. 2201CG5-10]MDY8136050.1 serine hydrolase domain-containing protein [Aquimarina sp. 2201CG5-10]
MMKAFPKSNIIFIALFFLITVVKSQTVNEKINEVMQKYIELDQFSGSILLAKNGEVLYKKAFGEADKELHVKNNLDTKYDICSMGKVFTGVSILQLEEQGKLQINDPVIKYLKDFPLGDKITIHHLLSHTSGIGNYFRHPEYNPNKNKLRQVNDLLQLIYEQELVFKTPGERFSYSNSGVVILGAIIEEITKQNYSDYIQEHILTPVKMYNTGIKYLDDIVENRANGYMRSISSNYTKNIYEIPTASPAGGILSTVNDLFKFDQALDANILISKASKEKMFTAVTSRYGYTFQVDNRHGNKIVGHGGGAPGFTSYFSKYLKDKYVLIVLSNYDNIAREVSVAIESILYNKDYKLPRQKLAQYIYQQQDTLQSFNTSKDLADFLKENNYTPKFGGHLNYVGYELMKEGKVDYAITIFKLNTILFSDIPNVYDSLAEAYENNNQYKLALKNYEQAVKIAKKRSHKSLSSFQSNLDRFKKKQNKDL